MAAWSVEALAAAALPAVAASATRAALSSEAARAEAVPRVTGDLRAAGFSFFDVPCGGPFLIEAAVLTLLRVFWDIVDVLSDVCSRAPIDGLDVAFIENE